MDVPKTLVCVLAETRAWKKTWPSFKENVLDVLGADLALCIGVDGSYDYANPFWQAARYRWTSREYDDYGDAFDAVQARILYSGTRPDWRKLLKVKKQWLGGIKGPEQHAGSAAILIYFRWLLLDHLRSSGALESYDRFVITRSDFIWLSPHPSQGVLTPGAVWVPDGESYRGLTDRHVVLSRRDVEPYLDLIRPIVCETDALFEAMQGRADWNLETYIKAHLERSGTLARVRTFPYLMYSVREEGGTTRWRKGFWNPQAQCFIKYPTEYAAARFWREASNRGARIEDLLGPLDDGRQYLLDLVNPLGRQYTALVRFTREITAVPTIHGRESGYKVHILTTECRHSLILVGEKGHIFKVTGHGQLSRTIVRLGFGSLLRLLAMRGIPCFLARVLGYRLVSIRPMPLEPQTQSHDRCGMPIT